MPNVHLPYPAGVLRFLTWGVLEQIRAKCWPDAERGIWYFPSERRWWMETADPHTNAAMIGSHVDAINITNARQVLAKPFLEQLERESS